MYDTYRKLANRSYNKALHENRQNTSRKFTAFTHSGFFISCIL